MTRRVLRAAALVAVLGGLLALAPAATTYAAPRHDDAAIAEDSPAGIWQSLADLWDRLIGVVSGGSGSEGDGDGSGAADEGGSDTSNSDGSPGVDPNG